MWYQGGLYQSAYIVTALPCWSRAIACPLSPHFLFVLTLLLGVLHAILHHHSLAPSEIVQKSYYPYKV